MNVILHAQDLPRDKPIALAAGSFDGLHLGHQALIQDACEQARASDGEPWILTFSPHPARVLAPETAPRLITTPAQRHALLQSWGIAGCLELPFGQELSETPAELFITDLAAAIQDLRSISIGPNWTFGYQAKGTPALLHQLSKACGFSAREIQPVQKDGRIISSTWIREAIGSGDLELATELLGRPYALTGVVVKGKQEGRTLGFPTANIRFEQEVLPSDGIYACRVSVGSRDYNGAGYFMHPSSDETPFIFEAHLIGEDLDLYGQQLNVELIRKTRDHVSFPAKETLIEGISQDVAQISQWLERLPKSGR